MYKTVEDKTGSLISSYPFGTQRSSFLRLSPYHDRIQTHQSKLKIHAEWGIDIQLSRATISSHFTESLEPCELRAEARRDHQARFRTKPGGPCISSWCVTVVFQSVKSLRHSQLFAAHQASLFITNSWSLLKYMSIKSVMPSNHLILCRPLLLLPSIFPSIRVFSNESALRIRFGPLEFGSLMILIFSPS